ncbi:MAG: tail fiber domain-containing protein [Clostridiales bacterium]|jgi:hypothetical protein|nr:tail fiber domain-containing protein [Clostridiales bacterium]
MPYINGAASLGGLDGSTPYFFEKGYFNGEVKAASYDTNSDERLKSNVEQIKSKDISQVLGKEYDMQGREGRQVGVIAQELKEQFPELVCEAEDEMKTLSIKESKLIYYLMDEVRRLKEELREKRMIE